MTVPPPLKGPHPKDFTIHCMGLVGCLFHLLHSTLLPLVPPFLVPLLLPELFPVSFSSVFLFNISNFFPIIPNIPDQTSYHPIHIVSLLYTSLVILLYKTLQSFFLACLDSSLYSSSNLSTRSLAFPKFSLGSQVSSSTVYPFYHTRYLSFPLNFLLFNIFSTLYSSSPLIITRRGHFFFWPST